MKDLGREERKLPENTPVRSGELGERGVVVGDVLRPAGEIVDRREMIDAEAMVEGGVHLLKPHRPVLDLAGHPVGRADHLSGSQAAAGEERALYMVEPRK